jgi:hypothetical protein
MKKQIITTTENWNSMGWELDAADYGKNLILELNTVKKTVKVLADNTEKTALPEYTFDDYSDTIQCLYDEGLLIGAIPGNSVIYNDDAQQKSAHVAPYEVSEMMGISEMEMRLYNGFDEINQDCYGFSFQHQDETPKYEMAEYNEI